MPGIDHLAHVGGLCLLVRLGDVAVDRVPHLRVHPVLYSFPAAHRGHAGCGSAATAGICQSRRAAPSP